jgi:glutamine synthetase
MVGSSANIACPNFIINTIVAEELKQFADVLEGAKDFDKALNDLLKKTVKEHGRIIFSGNNYSAEWEKEAEKRGLLNLKSTVDALPYYTLDKNVKLFESHKVLSKSEIHSRMEILLENYANIIHIEALTAIDMARKDIIPAVIGYQKFLIEELNLKLALSRKLNCDLEKGLIEKLSDLASKFNERLNILISNTDEYENVS